MATGLVPSCLETGLGQAAAPPAGPHGKLRLRLWMTSQALGQPGPSLEHVIQTRMYLTGAGH
jgi:hypothetical protein